MAIVSFWGNNEKETGQTISSIAVATMMSIEHNYKTLAITTGFKDKTIEESFWVPNKTANIQKILGVDKNKSAMESGVEGLARIVQSNIDRKGLVENYVKVVFRDRLDVLPSPITEEPKEYVELVKNYPRIIGMASQDYNLVFIDVDKRMPKEVQKEILLKSDLIIVTISQGQKSLDKYVELREANAMFKNPNIMVLIGKYDRFSKYNVKNVTRYLRERTPVSAISYNTLFFESSAEGKVADYFLRYNNITDKTDRNAVFMEEAKNTCNNIIFKLQELRGRR